MPLSAKLLPVLLVALACVLPRAQPIKRLPVVLWFEEYRDVLSGEARSNGMFRGIEMDVIDHQMTLRCVGPLDPKIVPPRARPPAHCDGVGGLILLSCSDGRQLLGEWHAESTCGAGYGKGMDAGGNVWHMTWSKDPAHARAAVDEARRAQASKPPLPRFDARKPSGGMRGANTGTAFFVTWEGHLITNHHVIHEAKKVHVKLDGDLAEATVIDTDPDNDLALLQVEAIRRPLPIAKRGGLAKGQEVFTLGYPLVQLQGQEQKATFGRINSLSGSAGDVRLAQIDVPIQPGNSGGPLLNRRGEVVGVVTSMLNAQVTLQVAGVVPQNVNYALKAHLVERLVSQNLSSWKPEPTRGRETAASFSELVAENAESVVLVYAR
jgi:S1-C subfamily serine protease